MKNINAVIRNRSMIHVRCGFWEKRYATMSLHSAQPVVEEEKTTLLNGLSYENIDK